MITLNSSDVRKDWSSVMDSVIRQKPAFIQRTRDRMILCTTETISQLVTDLRYDARQFVEDDGSITLSLIDMDIVANGKTPEDAKQILAQDIKDYAEDYYSDFELYSKAANRKAHLPYVLKALLAKSTKEVEEAIECRNGKN